MAGGIDSSIYAQYLRPVKSVDDFTAEADARDAGRLQLLLQRGQMADAETARGDRQRLLTTLQGLPSGATDDDRVNALRGGGFFAQADQVQKGAIDRMKTAADVGKTTADTGKVTADTAKTQYELAQSKKTAAIQQMASFQSPADALAALDLKIKAGEIPPEIGDLLKRSLPTDEAQFPRWQLRMIAGVDKPEALRELLTPHLQTNNTGGATVTQAIDKMTGLPVASSRVKNTQSPDNAATVAATVRGQNLANARAVDANSIAKEAQQTQVINDPERGVILVNKGTKVAVPAVGPDGKAIPSENAAKSTKQWGQLGESIAMARDLIPNATASGAGALVDKAANFVGQSTAGADSAAQLRTLAGWMTSNTPRMEGPQSDKDTAQYRIMAGQVGDETIPASQRLAALDVLDEIRSRYTGQPKPPKPAKAEGAGATKKIAGDAEYAALPSGATFIGPDGKTRRKP